MNNKRFFNQLSLHLLFLLTIAQSQATKPDLNDDSVAEQQNNLSVSYFASKLDPSLVGSGEVTVGERELFCYGFSTQSSLLTDFLRPKMPLIFNILHQKKSKNFPTAFTTAMKTVMRDFYDTYPEVNPCDVEAQHVLIGLVHLLNNRRTSYMFQTVNGKFKETYEPKEHIINPLRLYRSFLPIVQEGASNTGTQSPVRNTLQQNEIARRTLYKRPQELVDLIIKSDTNESLENLIQICESKWLKKCKHLSTADEYQSLRSKWIQLKNGADIDTVIIDATELEKSILYRWDHDRDELLEFAAKLRANKNPSAATALFLDNLIELTEPVETSPPKANPSCLTALCSFLSDE